MAWSSASPFSGPKSLLQSTILLPRGTQSRVIKGRLCRRNAGERSFASEVHNGQPLSRLSESASSSSSSSSSSSPSPPPSSLFSRPDHNINLHGFRSAVPRFDRAPAAVSRNDPASPETPHVREELVMLHKIVLAMPAPAPPMPPPIPMTVPTPTSTSKASGHLAVPTTAETVPLVDAASNSPRLASLLEHLRAGDTHALYRWMVPVAAGASCEGSGDRTAPLTQEERRRFRIAASLPPTMFSELLRCLDPFAVRAHRDFAPGIVVSPGLAQFTPLRAQVDRFGIRVLYTSLLRALLAVYSMRVGLPVVGDEESRDRGGMLGDIPSAIPGGSQDEAEAPVAVAAAAAAEDDHGAALVPQQTKGRPQRLLMRDYQVLLRCAGAASDIVAAKRFWHDMERAGYVTWRQSEAYCEFVRARFLTEALYAQSDPMRLRVRPVNLHRQKLTMMAGQVHRLERLRRALERYKTLRFGQNPHEPDYVEPLTRILRKTKPVRRLLYKTVWDGYARDERLLAALIVALGRTGSLVAVESVLAQYWRVRVRRETHGPGVLVSGGDAVAADAPLRPTAVLLDAVVQAYCSNGDVACGLQVLDHLSRRYGVAIPDRVWFDVLSWTYVMTAKPASTEWKWAGFPTRVLRPSTCEMVWAVMTAPPYNVRPGFAQYHVLIKTLIYQRRYDDALAHMRAAKAAYRAQLREHEAALLAYAEAARQDVAAGLRPALRRLQRAANRKWHMRYCFQTWCWQLLKKAQPRAADDPLIVRTIPHIIDEFRPFVGRGLVRARDAGDGHDDNSSGSSCGSGNGSHSHSHSHSRSRSRTTASLGIRYRILTGYVHLHEPRSHLHPTYESSYATVDLPALRPHDAHRLSRRLQDDHQLVSDAQLADGLVAARDRRGHTYYVAPEAERWREIRLVRGVLRRRDLWQRHPVMGVPRPHRLGRGTPREWLVREFA